MGKEYTRVYGPFAVWMRRVEETGALDTKTNELDLCCFGSCYAVRTLKNICDSIWISRHLYPPELPIFTIGLEPYINGAFYLLFRISRQKPETRLS